MRCSRCGNRRYAEWCSYCDTETPAGRSGEDLTTSGVRKAVQAVQRIKDHCDDRASHLFILDECDRALGALADLAAGDTLTAGGTSS